MIKWKGGINWRKGQQVSDGEKGKQGRHGERGMGDCNEAKRCRVLWTTHGVAWLIQRTCSR